jgi:hypothetical protein
MSAIEKRCVGLFCHTYYAISNCSCSTKHTMPVSLERCRRSHTAYAVSTKGVYILSSIRQDKNKVPMLSGTDSANKSISNFFVNLYKLHKKLKR